MAEPPFDAGAVNAIEACSVPGVAAPIVGAPGTAAPIVIEKLCVADPDAFVAVTTPVNVPVAEGEPETAPVVVLSERPVGKAPVVMA